MESSNLPALLGPKKTRLQRRARNQTAHPPSLSTLRFLAATHRGLTALRAACTGAHPPTPPLVSVTYVTAACIHTLYDLPGGAALARGCRTRRTGSGRTAPARWPGEPPCGQAPAPAGCRRTMAAWAMGTSRDNNSLIPSKESVCYERSETAAGFSAVDLKES